MVKSTLQPPSKPFKLDQKILFAEVGKSATQIKYVHMIIPLNIMIFFTQSEILQTFTKAIRDAGVYGMKKLYTIVEQIRNLDKNLPYNATRQNRQDNEDQYI